MPFTPFHWGFSILIQACFIFLDPLALFMGSIAPDIEGISSVFLFPELNLPLHGPLHSFLGAFLLGIIVGLSSWLCFKLFFAKIIRILKIEIPFSLPKYSLRCSLLSSFIGTFSHIILDAPLYGDMNPWYPIKSVENHFLNTVESSYIYLFCVICFLIGGSILFFRILRYQKS